MKKIASAICLIILTCFWFSGCSGVSFNTSDLMRPPRATGEKAGIQKIIDSTANGKYTFKYPLSGNYRSAIVMYDITDDGQDDAIAFYRTQDDAITHILIMRQNNAEWELVGNFETKSPEISKISFADINGDDYKEIIVSFTTYSSDLSSISIYSYNGSEIDRLDIAETCTDYVIGDFTDNGVDDILLLSLLNNDVKASAKLLDYNKSSGRYIIKSSVEMDSGVSVFANIVYGNIANGVKGAVIDGQGVDNNYYTQIIFYNKFKNKLENSLYSTLGDSKSMHRQNSAISIDIDDDGIIEIPTTSVISYSGIVSDSVSQTVTEVVYNVYNTKKMTYTEKYRYIIYPQYDIAYKIPPKLYGKITAKIDEAEQTLTVYSLSADGTNQKSAMLFTIRVYDKQTWAGNDNSTYKFLEDKSDYIVTYLIGTNSRYSITKSELLKSISYLDIIK